MVAISSFPNTSPHRARALRSGSQRYMKAAGYGGSGRPAASRGALTLIAMHAANPDPGFWRALAAAGSGQALVLAGLHAANPDPGFWRMLGSFRDACRSCSAQQIATNIRLAARAEAIRRERIRLSIISANANADRYPPNCPCFQLPIPLWEWVHRGSSGIINDADVGGGVRTDGHRIRVVIRDVTLLPGTFSVTVGNDTQSVASLGAGSHTLEFGGCFGCTVEDVGISWSTPISPGWSAPYVLPTYGVEYYRYEQTGWRWP
jgi:hypothetical protein